MNNIKQKNIIQSFNTSDQMPYGSDDVRFVNNQTIDANSLNNRLQQMVDNDLFVENSIKNFSDYQVGPKYTIDAGSDTLNGNKYFDGYDDILDKLSILQKVNKPYQATLSCVRTDNVNYITQYNGTYYAGTTDKILSSGDGYQWDDFYNGKSYCYYQDEGIFLLGCGRGILSVNQNNTQQLKNGNNTNIFSNGEYATAIGVDRVVTPSEGGLNIVVGTSISSNPRVYFGQLDGKNVTFSAPKQISQSGVPHDIRHRNFDWGYNLTNYVMIGAENEILQSGFRTGITATEIKDNVSDGAVLGTSLYVLDGTNLVQIGETSSDKVKKINVRKIKRAETQSKLYYAYTSDNKIKFGYVDSSNSIHDLSWYPDIAPSVFKDFDVVEIDYSRTYIFVVKNNTKKVGCYYKETFGEQTIKCEDLDLNNTVDSIDSVYTVYDSSNNQIIMYLRCTVNSATFLRDYRFNVINNKIEQITTLTTLSGFSPIMSDGAEVSTVNVGPYSGIYGSGDEIWYIRLHIHDSKRAYQIRRYDIPSNSSRRNVKQFGDEMAFKWTKKLNLNKLGQGLLARGDITNSYPFSPLWVEFFRQDGEAYELVFQDIQDIPVDPLSSLQIDDIAITNDYSYMKSDNVIYVWKNNIHHSGTSIILKYVLTANSIVNQIFPFFNTNEAVALKDNTLYNFSIYKRAAVNDGTLENNSSIHYKDGLFGSFVADRFVATSADNTTYGVSYNDVGESGSILTASSSMYKPLEKNPSIYAIRPDSTMVYGVVGSTLYRYNLVVPDSSTNIPAINPLQFSGTINKVFFIGNTPCIIQGTKLYVINYATINSGVGANNVRNIYKPIPQVGNDDIFSINGNNLTLYRNGTQLGASRNINGNIQIFDSRLVTSSGTGLSIYNHLQWEDLTIADPSQIYDTCLTAETSSNIIKAYPIGDDHTLVVTNDSSKFYIDTFTDYEAHAATGSTTDYDVNPHSFSLSGVQDNVSISYKYLSVYLEYEEKDNPQTNTSHWEPISSVETIQTSSVSLFNNEIIDVDSYVLTGDKYAGEDSGVSSYITETLNAVLKHGTKTVITKISSDSFEHSNVSTTNLQFSTIEFFTVSSLTLQKSTTAQSVYIPSKYMGHTKRGTFYLSSGTDYITDIVYDNNRLYFLTGNSKSSNKNLHENNISYTNDGEISLTDSFTSNVKSIRGSLYNHKDGETTHRKIAKLYSDGNLTVNDSTYSSVSEIVGTGFKQNDSEFVFRQGVKDADSNKLSVLIFTNEEKIEKQYENNDIPNWNKIVYDEEYIYVLKGNELFVCNSTDTNHGFDNLTKIKDNVEDFDVKYKMLSYVKKNSNEIHTVVVSKNSGAFTTNEVEWFTVNTTGNLSKIKILDQDLDVLRSNGAKRLLVKENGKDYYYHIQDVTEMFNETNRGINNISKMTNDNIGNIYVKHINDNRNISAITKDGFTEIADTHAKDLYPADNGFVIKTGDSMISGLWYYNKTTGEKINLGNTNSFSGTIKGLVKYGNDYYVESDNKIQKSTYNLSSYLTFSSPSNININSASQLSKQNCDIIMVKDSEFKKYNHDQKNIVTLVESPNGQDNYIIMQTKNTPNFLTLKDDNKINYKSSGGEWQEWTVDNNNDIKDSSMGFQTNAKKYVVQSGKLKEFSDPATNRTVFTLLSSIGAQKFIDIGDDEYLVATTSNGVQRRKHNSMIPLTNNDLSVHSLEFGNFDAQNPRVFFDSNNEVKMASSYKKMSSQSEMFLSVGGSDTKIRSIIPNSWNNFIIGTDKGIYTTKYEYELVDNLSYFTEDDINEIYDGHLTTLSNSVNTKITNHNDTYHGSNNLIPYINDNIVGVNFENANIDNILSTIEFGDINNSELTVYTHNFLVDDTPKFNYIKKTYLSGDMVELYVFIDTTNTYYINDTAHDGREVKNYQRANLKEFGEKSESISCTSDEYIENKYKTEISVAFNSSYSNYKLLDVQMNGCSLPLKIYKYTDPEAPSLSPNSLTGMYNSSIVQTKIVYNNSSSSDDHILYNNEDVKYLKAYCFGTDQQSLRVLLKKNANI